jgi:trigger factor
MKNYTVKMDEATAVVSFKVESAVVNEQVEAAYKKLSQEKVVKGFRPGHAPRELFEKTHGKEGIYQLAQDEMINDAYGKFFVAEGQKLNIIGRPVLKEVKFEEGQDFEFTINVPVMPEIKLGEYTGSKVTIEEKAVNAEDINKVIDAKLSESKMLKVVDREAKNGDTVVIDFEGFLDGVAFDGGKGQNHPLELGSNSFIPGFEEQLVGSKAGQDVEVKVTFPEDYQAENLAGKETVFNCLVHEVKESVMPKLDDEFVASLGLEGVKTVDEYKESVMNDLKKEAKKENELKLRTAVIDDVAGRTEVAVPEVMIEDQAKQMRQENATRMQQQGLSFEMYLQMTGKTEAEVMEEFKQAAKKDIKRSLVLEKIAEVESIEAEQADFDKEVNEIVEMYKMEEKEVRELIEKQRANVEYEIKMRKTVDLLVAKNS